MSDLKSALARLQGQSPLKAQVDAKTWSRQGDGKETDETQGSASVTIEEGAPVASRSSQTVSGRAYVLVSFEFKNEEDHVCSVVGDRLVSTKKEPRISGSGMGEKGEGRAVKTLQLLSS